MSIFINVVNQRMYISSSVCEFVSGSQNFVRFQFNLSEEWDGLKVFAQFRQGERAFNQYLDDENSVCLPAEIKAGTCTLMLYGSHDTTIGTSNYITLKIDKNMLVSDASSTNISTSLYEQLVSKVNVLSDRVSNIEDGIFDGAQIEEAVAAEIERYIQSGSLSEIVVKDGTITNEKLSDEVRSAVQKANSAMQPSVYDPNGIETDIYRYVDDKISEIDISGGSDVTVEDVLEELPITVSQDGYTDISGLRRLIDGKAVRSGNTITFTTTLQGDEVHTDVITLGDDEYPVKIVSDGVESSWTWEGFDA